jgi:hypothetical protein
MAQSGSKPLFIKTNLRVRSPDQYNTPKIPVQYESHYTSRQEPFFVETSTMPEITGSNLAVNQFYRRRK